MDEIAIRARQIFEEHRWQIFERTDRLFAGLMVFQWLLGIGFAFGISPSTWDGVASRTHVHVWAAIFLGGAIAALPVAMSLARPGTAVTRHVIAVGQMFTSALLIHLTGGRIETHFHVFGSLAFLAFYRDWRVLVSASAVVAGDHFLRGLYWPQSVYGVLMATPWRALEHAAWVVFEDVVLIGSLRQSLREMREIAERQAGIESVNARTEREVVARTSELRTSEESLNASEKRFRALVERSSDGIFLIGRDTRIAYASDSALRMLGRRSEEVLGKHPFEFVHAEDVAQLRRRFEECAANPGREVLAEFRVLQPDGSVHVMEAVGVNRFGDPAVAAVVINTRDITARKRAEEALHKSENQLRHVQKMEAVGRLAGGVAHDSNNLLNVITGYGHIVAKRLPAQDPLQPKLREILKAGERAAGLTQQLLAFSRKQVREPRLLDLNAVVGDMDKMLRRLIGEDIDLRALLRPDLATVKADQGQLEQVIMNLAVNARDAMPGGGRLTLETANVWLDVPGLGHQPFVLLAVSDDGVGMDAATQDRIFEPFFTTKAEGKGTGLGLATVYGIVEQSGGRVSVYSEPGKGTTFNVYLPALAEEAEPAYAPADASETPRGTERILLAEDEDAMRGLAREVLEAKGYEVVEAHSGDEALDLCLSGTAPIDLVVTDVVMPGISGAQLAERLRAAHPDLSVLFMSGYAEGALVHQGMVGAGVSILQKPFNPDQLVRKVRKALDVASRPTSLGGVGLEPSEALSRRPAPSRSSPDGRS